MGAVPVDRPVGSLRYRGGVRTAVVMPAFNEAEALPGVLAELAEAVPDHEVIVVDDGSSDDTAGVAAAAGVTCLRLPFNLGIGGALRLGFRYAADEGFDRAYQFDADGQHDPSQIATLLAGLEHADMVVGTRFGARGADDPGSSEGAYRAGWVLQGVAISLGVLVPMMFFLGAVFGLLWGTADLLGRKIDRERAAAYAALEDSADPDPATD